MTVSSRPATRKKMHLKGTIVDVGGGRTTTYSSSIAWQSGERIFYNVDGQVFDDIGVRAGVASTTNVGPTPDAGSVPKPPRLSILSP